MSARQSRPVSSSVYARACAERLHEDPRDPDALFARAAFHAASGRLATAVSILNELAGVAPEYPGLWRFKATVYQEMGDARMASLCLAAARREDVS